LPAEASAIPELVQSPTSEHILALPHHQSVETDNSISQNREEMSPTSTLYRTDEAMKRIVTIDRSNTWEGAVRRIKWVMDTLGPIAEVRVIRF
jgi:hypothetical protein